MKRICNGLVLAATLATFSTSSFAIGTAEQREACTPDVFRLCSSQIPDVARITACLPRENLNLSKPCQAVMNPPTSKVAR